jgi:predicted 3-demethylubiquinone-9 3-methyltransferase (glyoxalase superfamily)
MSAKVRTCLWFESRALEAVRFYVSLLPDSHIEDSSSFEHMLTGEEDGVSVIRFTLGGTPYQAMEAGPHHEFNDAMSIVVTTQDQAETDRLWEALTADGGKSVQCGWLKDKFGVSWQIIPRVLMEIVSGPASEKSQRAMRAMFQMQKIDIAALRKAYDGTD